MQKTENTILYKAALYIRLSKEDGDKLESNSISNQRDLIHAFLRGKPEIQICEEKVDDGYSGIDFNRPAIMELLEEIKHGSINCIIVKDLSRFGRNYIETGRYIQQIFPFMGIRFIAINDNYDSLNPENQTDNIILPFKNLMNDSYCRDISIKVRSQIEVRQKRGDYVGSFPVFGYFRDTTQKNRLVIDEVAAATVREIFTMRIAGQNNKRIADYLNEHGIPSPMEYKMLLHWRFSTSFKLKPQAKWSPMAVDRILKNEIYTGVMVQGKERTLNYKVKKRIKVPKEEWVRVEDTHKAIISKEDFALVQSLKKCDTRTAPGEQDLYLFSGLLRCCDCGCNMVRKPVKSGDWSYTYYVCSTNKNKKSVCSSHRIREDYLCATVLEMLQHHISLVCCLDELLNIIEGLPLQEYDVQKKCEQLEQRKNELVRNQQLKISVYEDYKEGLLSKKDYLEMKSDYEGICKQIESAIDLLEEEIESLMQNKKSHSSWIEDFKAIGNVTELSRGILVLTIEQITIFDASAICIQFKYQNEFENTLKLLKSAIELKDTKEALPTEGCQSIKSFLTVAKEVE